ncbi:fungal-specific transcription factor domain-containing protein [Aspergillus insuetus]
MIHVSATQPRGMHISPCHLSKPAVLEANLNVPAAVSHAQRQTQRQPPERRRDGCTECRRKKVKCDLATPVCSRCTRYPRECKYVSRFVVMAGGKSEAKRAGQRRRSRDKSPKISTRSADVAASPGEAETTLKAGNMCVAPPVPSTYISRLQAKMSLQAIVSQTTTLVFPLAAQTFLDRLLSSAMETPHLLFAILATSDSHARRRLPTSTLENTTLNNTNNAISGLRAALSLPNERNSHRAVEMAMTAMALCTNDVCNGNIDLFRVHLNGVRGMLVSGLVSGRNIKDPLAMYLFKWFAALDVSAGLSLFHQSTLLSGGLYRSYRAAISAPRGEADGVDDICGYSLDLLPILAEIGELARERYSKPNCTTLLERGQALEARITALTTNINSSPNHPPSETQSELHATNSAFIHTALLHLHRRVHHLPKTDPRVRTDVTNILNALLSIRPASTANILLLWPIFSAGCETDEVAERALVDERMGIMQDMGMGNFTRARGILNRFWAAGTWERWDVWLAGVGIDLVLF